MQREPLLPVVSSREGLACRAYTHVKQLVPRREYRLFNLVTFFAIHRLFKQSIRSKSCLSSACLAQGNCSVMRPNIQYATKTTRLFFSLSFPADGGGVE